MPEEHAKSFGGGSAETQLNPIVLLAMIVTLLLILTLPRKRISAPLLIAIFLIPLGQSVVIGGLHFFVSRIIILVALTRLAMNRSSSGTNFAGGYNTIDRAFVWCMVSQAVATMILFASSSSMVYEFGFLLDFVGAYFVLRWLITDEADLCFTLKCFAVVSLLIAVGMLIEQQKLFNVFSYIGGGRTVPEIREGKIRSQGVFQHPLLAGSFAATLLPLFILLWSTGARLFAIAGFLGATTMTIATNSSTPLLAYVSGLVGICFWPLRKHMRYIRWGLVFLLVSLHLVMKAPVWMLIARVDLTGGSSGYHRAELIDAFIRHFSDWWLIGVKDTGTWGWDLWDAQNQFVSVGEGGGLLALFFFLALLTRSFAALGKAREANGIYRNQQWRLWFLGAALFSHIVAFFGVNYFDQSRVNLLALLAMISAITAPLSAKRSEPSIFTLETVQEADSLEFQALRRNPGGVTPFRSLMPGDLDSEVAFR